MSRPKVDLDRIESAIDRLDSVVAMLVNISTLPDKTHVTALRLSLPEIAEEMRLALTGKPSKQKAE